MTTLIGFMIAVAMPGVDAGPLPDSARGAAPGVDRVRIVAEPDSGVVIERRIIIRIPVMPRAERPEGAAPPARRVPVQRACIASQVIRGVSIGEGGEVTLITVQNARYRATLERGCNVVAFQSGFYLDAGRDGAVCAGRDMLRARSGMICLVTGLSKLPGF